MGAVDKVKNKLEDTFGEAKEKLGSATGNEDLETEGKKDQASSTVKDAGEKSKDTFSN